MENLSQRIREIRDARQIGIIEARDIARRERLLSDIQGAETVADLRRIVFHIASKLPLSQS